MNRQFKVLYRVFLMRVVDLEMLSADGDPTRLLGNVAALLAAISLLFCTPLILSSGVLDKAGLWTFEHMLFALTMLVVGLFSVLSWDAIFPDKRDVLVLAPLPVAPRTIFLSKLAAMGAALGVVVLALNGFTGLLWPLYFVHAPGAGAILRSFAAYWTTLAAAGACMFFSVLTLQGVVSQLLPRQIFLRLSAVIQVAAFCLFLGVYILEPSLEAPQALAAVENQHRLAWLPTYWFLGLFHQLNGDNSPLRPVFDGLAMRAWIALGTVVAGAGMVLALSYLQMLRRTVQEPEIVRSGWSVKLPRPGALSGAVMLFCLRAVFRSRQHRLLLSFYFGVGCALVLAYLRSPFEASQVSGGHGFAVWGSSFISASVLMMGLSVAGMRIVASIPIALPANWVFRITELHGPAAYLRAVRRSFLVLSVVPVWLVAGLVCGMFWPMRLAAEHLLLLGLVGAVLVELCLGGFGKIPFTCSYLPGKGRMQYVFWVCAVFLLPLVSAWSRLEVLLLNRPLGYLGTLAVLGLTLAGLWSYTAAVAGARSAMKFQELNAPEIFSLSLNLVRTAEESGQEG